MFEFFHSAWDNLNTFPYAQISPLVWLLIALALTFDFLNGLHDAANSIATVVSTRVLSPQMAVIWAAFFNFVAFVVFPLKVAGTIQKDIVDQSLIQNADIANQLIAATLIAACGWNVFTWWLGLPTSSSHALIGGMVGAAITLTGDVSGVKIEGLAWIVMFIVLAPLIGLILGMSIAVTVLWLFHLCKATPLGVDQFFRRGQFVSAALFSLGHGGNDAQKTMGIIFVLLLATYQANANAAWPGRFALTETSFAKLTDEKDPNCPPRAKLQFLEPLRGQSFSRHEHLEAELVKVLPPADFTQYRKPIIKAADHAQVPTEIVLACHLAMGVGTLFGGWRIVKTMGQGIIRLRPVDGFCAETGAAMTLFITTFLRGIPISTTHTITGAIVGVGTLKRFSAVRWGIASRVVWAWVLTIPGSACIAALTVAVFRLFS